MGTKTIESELAENKALGVRQKITPFLWFDGNAEEAVRFYTSIFKDSKITRIQNYSAAVSEVSGQPEGSVMLIEFELEGQEFAALNGGPDFKFTPAISLAVSCDTQEELDALWDKLKDGGQTMDCGWVTDKYGVTWEVTPAVLYQFIADEDPEKVERVMEAMMEMEKLEIAPLERAYKGE